MADKKLVFKASNSPMETLDRLQRIKVLYNEVPEAIEITSKQLVYLMNSQSLVKYTSHTEGLSPLFGIPLVIKD